MRLPAAQGALGEQFPLDHPFWRVLPVCEPDTDLVPLTLPGVQLDSATLRYQPTGVALGELAPRAAATASPRSERRRERPLGRNLRDVVGGR